MDATLAFRHSLIDMTDDVPALRLALSFEEFYRAEYPGLVGVATALVGSPEAGEDLTQDAMVASLMRWQKVQRLERPGAGPTGRC